MARLKIKPRNKVRFAFWGAEEVGLLGSTYYVAQSLRAQAGATSTSTSTSICWARPTRPPGLRRRRLADAGDPDDAGPAGSDMIEQVFLNYFAAAGLATEPTPFDGRSDYGPFIDVGIPAGGLFSGAEEIKTAAQAAKFGGTAGVALIPAIIRRATRSATSPGKRSTRWATRWRTRCAEFAYRASRWCRRPPRWHRPGRREPAAAVSLPRWPSPAVIGRKGGAAMAGRAAVTGSGGDHGYGIGRQGELRRPRAGGRCPPATPARAPDAQSRPRRSGRGGGIQPGPSSRTAGAAGQVAEPEVQPRAARTARACTSRGAVLRAARIAAPRRAA